MQGVNMVELGNLAVNVVSNVSKSASDGKNNFSSFLNSGKNKIATNSLNISNAKTTKINTSKTVNDVNDVNVSSNPDTGTKVTANTGKDNVMKDDGKSLDMDAVDIAIVDKVKDVLEIDDETLNNAMTALGLVPTDLLDFSNLIKLVAFIDGGNSAFDMLTNESMMLDYKELSAEISSIDWESLTGMSMEEFKAQLDKMMTDVDMLSDTDISGEMTEDIPESDNIKVNVIVDNKVQSTEDTAEGQAVNDDNQLNDDLASVSTEKKGDNQGSSFSDDTLSKENSEENLSGQVQLHNSSDLHGNGNVTSNQTDFIQNLNQAVNEAAQVTDSQQANMQQMVDIVNQVVERIKVTMGTDNTSMELQLNPEHLGKVLLSVASKNGVMTANFTVQSDEARAALESQMYTLRENLESKNLKVEVVEVQIADSDFTQRDQTGSEDQKNPNNGNGKQMKFSFDDEEDENVSDVQSDDVRKKVMLDSGNSVDFTA